MELNLSAVPFAPSLGVHLFAAFAGGLELERSPHLSLGWGGAGDNEICTHWYRGLPGVQAVLAVGWQLSEGQAKLCKLTVHVFLCPGDRGNPKGRLASSFNKMICPQVEDEYLQNCII